MFCDVLSCFNVMCVMSVGGLTQEVKLLCMRLFLNGIRCNVMLSLGITPKDKQSGKVAIHVRN